MISVDDDDKTGLFSASVPLTMTRLLNLDWDEPIEWRNDIVDAIIARPSLLLNDSRHCLRSITDWQLDFYVISLSLSQVFALEVLFSSSRCRFDSTILSLPIGPIVFLFIINRLAPETKKETRGRALLWQRPHAPALWPAGTNSVDWLVKDSLKGWTQTTDDGCMLWVFFYRYKEIIHARMLELGHVTDGRIPYICPSHPLPKRWIDWLCDGRKKKGKKFKTAARKSIERTCWSVFQSPFTFKVGKARRDVTKSRSGCAPLLFAIAIDTVQHVLSCPTE